jgi:uncharacterized protein (TIGR03382 family)
VSDEDSNQDWAFGKIAVWDSNTELYDPYKRAIVQEESTGCSTSGTGVAGGLALGAIVSLLARRRRS